MRWPDRSQPEPRDGAGGLEGRKMSIGLVTENRSGGDSGKIASGDGGAQGMHGLFIVHVKYP